MTVPGNANELLLAADGSAIDPRNSFDVKLYTGNGSTQTISGLGFSPDLVWIKARSAVREHRLTDVVRGATKALYSNAVDAEVTETGGITAFNADGFSLGSGNGYNATSETHAAWCWDAGSSTVTNTSGSISSQVRANASAGFSIVTYTGTGANATVGHGLGVAPKWVIVKRRTTGTSDWCVWVKEVFDASNTSFLFLSATNGSYANASVFNSSATTSTTFPVGSNTATNGSGDSHVAYCFAPVAGYSAFGSYTGNGSATGPTISGLGFKPYFLMVKASSTTGDWWMYDAVRSTANPRTSKLLANSSGGEDTAGEDVDFLDDGFRIKSSASGINQNAATYIYAAFA
jgi:hypothetical protein